MKAGASSSQIAPEEPSTISTASTGPAPSSAHSSNDRAKNVPASPPGTSVPVKPTASSLSGQQPHIDIIECRASSTQSEPAPTAPLLTTIDPGTSSRWRIIDLDAASSEESEEEEEKDGYTAYGKVEAVHSEDENDPEPTIAPTQPHSFKDSSDAGGSMQLTSDGSNTHAHVLGSPVSTASFGKNEVRTTSDFEIQSALHTIYFQACHSDHLLPPCVHSSLVWEQEQTSESSMSSGFNCDSQRDEIPSNTVVSQLPEDTNTVIHSLNHSNIELNEKKFS